MKSSVNQQSKVPLKSLNIISSRSDSDQPSGGREVGETPLAKDLENSSGKGSGKGVDQGKEIEGESTGDTVPDASGRPAETGGPSGPDPTRYGDWERKGRCIDF